MFDAQSFSGRLKILRGSLSQQEFGENLGVYQAYINHLETGRRKPTIDFLLTLSHHCRKSVDSLLKGGDFKPAKREKLSVAMSQMAKKLEAFEKDLEKARLEENRPDSEVA